MRPALFLTPMLMLILTGVAAPRPAAAQGCADAHAAQAEADLIAGINRLRAGSGVAALRAERGLSRIAQAHACDNAARASYSHTGSDGSDLGGRMRRGGYAYRQAAENTGLGHASVPAMVGFWNRSAGHRTNMLNPGVTEAGLGLARTADGRNAWVLVLGRRQ